MAGHTRVAVGYNAQLAVDAKHKLIVEQEVTNQVVDMGLLKQTAEPARAILGVERIDVVADRGYFKIEDIEACEEAGLTPHVPKPQRGSGMPPRFLPQGRVPLRPRPGCFELPGRANPGTIPRASDRRKACRSSINPNSRGEQRRTENTPPLRCC
jgi:hypothetical protein